MQRKELALRYGSRLGPSSDSPRRNTFVRVERSRYQIHTWQAMARSESNQSYANCKESCLERVRRWNPPMSLQPVREHCLSKRWECCLGLDGNHDQVSYVPLLLRINNDQHPLSGHQKVRALCAEGWEKLLKHLGKSTVDTNCPW